MGSINNPATRSQITGYLNALDYGAIGDGSTDSTTALQNWLNACVSSGQPGFLPQGVFNITSALTITGACTIRGAGVHDLWGSEQGSGTQPSGAWPTVSPFVTGAMIQQSTINTDAIQITAVGRTVDLSDFGIIFATPWKTTGHGIKAQSANVTTYPNTGPVNSDWRNLSVWGTDGSHYGYYVMNPILCNFTNLRSYGGGGMNLLAQNDTQSDYGNATITQCYFVVMASGTANALNLSSQGAGGGNLTLITTLRTQADTVLSDSANVFPGQVTGGVYPSGVAAPTSSQHTFFADTSVSRCLHLAADWETNVSGSTFVAPNGSHILIGSIWDGSSTHNFGDAVIACNQLILQGEASRTDDMMQFLDDAAHLQFALANAGTGVSPRWAMRLRAVANAESMAQTHTLGAYSGRAVQVLDDTGATVGWLPLYA